MDGLIKEYFDWMQEVVSDGKPDRKASYRHLLMTMFETEFIYQIEMDGNRFEDGIDLRYRFGFERGYPDFVIANKLDTRVCSVLEMLVALAMRCEEHIMDNPEIGNRTGEWFWDMVDNLGLSEQTDQNFDVVYTRDVIERFLSRDYEPDGRGGLFTIKHVDADMRDVEIWYQMMWHLDEYLRR